MEHHGNDVNDKSIKVQGGKQCITTVDGCAIPLQIQCGLAYMGMHPPSDKEYDALPHVVLTSDMDWDPAVVDNELDFDEWLDARMEEDDQPGPNSYGDCRFDRQGYFRHQVYKAHFFDAYQDLPVETYDDLWTLSI